MGLGASHQTGWTALVAKLMAPRKGGWLYDLISPMSGVSTPQLQTAGGVAIGVRAVKK